MSEKKIPVSILLPEQVENCIKRLAKETGRSKSAYIRQILRRYVRYMENRDNPDAEPIDWDIDKFYSLAAPTDKMGG